MIKAVKPNSLYPDGAYGFISYDNIEMVMRSSFINAMKKRKVVVGVKEDGYSPETLLLDGSAAPADYEELLRYCYNYYPGVGTLIKNKFGQANASIQDIMEE